MFERFTQELRMVVTEAVRRAGERGDARIGTEHLLVAIAATRDNAAAELLGDVGASAAALDSALIDLDLDALRIAGVTESTSPSDALSRPRRRHGHLPFNGGAKRALRSSLHHAVGQGRRSIGPDHLLLALTSGPESDMSMVLLRRLGLDPHALHTQFELRMRRSA